MDKETLKSRVLALIQDYDPDKVGCRTYDDALLKVIEILDDETSNL